jgi:hypothetical protein
MSTIASNWRFGPLTTIFTPEAQCFKDLQLAPTSTLPSAVLTFSLGNPSASCHPSPDHAFYSPGRCPSGYATVTAAPAAAANAYQVPLAEDESASICCPSAFSYSTATGGYCFQHAPQTTATVTPQVAAAGIFNAPPLPGTASVYVGEATITAQAVVIRYRSSDFSALDITPTATSMESLSSSPSSSASASGSSSSSSAMSSSTKLAVVLGISLPLAAFILAAIVLFFFLRRKRQHLDEAVERPKSKHFVQTMSTSTLNVADRSLPSIPPPTLPKRREERANHYDNFELEDS